MSAHAKPALDNTERNFNLLKNPDGSWMHDATPELAAEVLQLTVQQIRHRVKKGTLASEGPRGKKRILVSSLRTYEPYTPKKRSANSKKVWAGHTLEKRSARANKSAAARSEKCTHAQLSASAQKGYETRLANLGPKKLSDLRKSAVQAASSKTAGSENGAVAVAACIKATPADAPSLDAPKHNLSLLPTADLDSAVRIDQSHARNPFARRGSIFRNHKNACPFKHLGRTSHDKCDCMVFIDCYRGGVRIQRSLRTRIWEEAERKLQRFYDGESLDAILIGRLFPHHGKACPFKHLGRSCTKCRCMIFVEKLRTREGKLIPTLSLRTRDLAEAERKMQRLYNGESLEALGLGRLFRCHRNNCPYKTQGATNLGRTPHDKCKCPIKMRVKRRRNGGYGTRSLFTRDWDDAVRFLEEEERRAAAVPVRSTRGRTRKPESVTAKIAALLKRNPNLRRVKFHQVKGCFHDDRVKKAISDSQERRKIVKHANVVLGRLLAKESN